MNHILRPLPFVLASTNIGTMILNHCDRHTHANNPIKNGGVLLCCPGVALFSGECTVGFYGEPLYLGRGCGILVRKWPSGFLPAQPGSRVVSPPGLVCVCWPVGLSPGLQTGAGPWSVRDRGHSRR